MPVTTFLASVETLLQHGNATEHSYRPALKTLVEHTIAGASALNEPKHAVYGAPDFLIQQNTVPIGHMEAKDIGVSLDNIIADSERETPKTQNGKQLKRYRAALPNLLYTDGLEWHWFVEGTPRLDAPVRIATWDRGTNTLHRTASAAHDLTTLLQQFAAHRVLLVGTPHDLAQRLAQVARWMDEVINAVLKDEQQHGSLHQQLAAFRQTLLPTLTPAEFADMYAQTLVYGLFAARASQPDNLTFTRYDAARSIPKTNPFLRKMFQQIAGYDLDERIAWLVDDCARLLERTDMSEVLHDFGKATKQEDPVVHFYETFLAAYDPRTREMRGVYYTPEPVVSYIVRSVDHLLHTRFGKSMGLADGETIILDPATGTATFLHAIVQHIHKTLRGMGMADAWNQYVPEKLLPRLHGFELLMAPYTIAHLKLSLLLQQLGYTFGSDERLGVYLTNALSDAPTGQQALPFAQFIADEGRAADAVKHDAPVMVVLGNPPYSGHSANKNTWIDDLLRGKLPDGRRTESYYEVDGKPLGERNPKYLQDDYVKFVRFGQWRINQTGGGILAFISNNGYLDNPTFRGMRESLLREFDTIYLLNLHGNSRKKERAPDGSPDDNVFDIQQGVAIGIFVRQGLSHEDAEVYYADVWGKRKGKYRFLNEHDITTVAWQKLAPSKPWYLFVPQNTDAMATHQQAWDIRKVFPVNTTAIKTHRDHFVYDFDQKSIENRMSVFRNPSMTDEEIRQSYQLPDTRDWKLVKARQTLQNDREWKKKIALCSYRPFDTRTLYYHPSIVELSRTEIMRHMQAGENICLGAGRQGIAVSETEWSLVVVTDKLLDTNIFRRGGCNVFPLYLYPNGHEHPSLFPYEDGRRPNLSAAFIHDIEQRLGLRFIPDGCGDLVDTIGPEDIFHYLYAVLHSPTYRTRYAEFLKIDFPRIPIMSDTTIFKTLAEKGAVLVDLHLLRLPGSGGIGGAGGAAILTRPGDQGVTQHRMTAVPIEKIRYDATQQRVVIASDSYVAGVEPETWDMQIGGYKPLQKWLKDRKGRTLSFDDAIHYMQMVVALRETQRVMGEIDEAGLFERQSTTRSC